MFMDFANCIERKKENVFTQTGWIGAATACPERDIAGQHTGPGPAARPHGATTMTSKAPAWNMPWPRGDGSRRSRVHLTRGPGPQGRRHAGPICRVHPQPPARTEQGRGSVDGGLPALQGISGDAPPTGLLRGPGRT